MRRSVGAVVVMGLIGAWNLAGQWFVNRGGVHDIAPPAPVPVVVPTAVSSPRPAAPAARGKIVTTSPPAPFTENPLVFLSTAPPESLDLVPGVGPVLASRIIEARRARGSFTSWNDVLAVKGIGPRTVARWQSFVTGQ